MHKNEYARPFSIFPLSFEFDRVPEVHHIYIILMLCVLGLIPYPIIMNLPSDYETDFDGPAAYQITVLGTIVSSWSERLEGMAINRLILDDGTTYTVLTGNLTDQAALTGVLNTIYELHLPLVAVNKLQITGSKREEFPPED